jgi:hypothetical protein
MFSTKTLRQLAAYSSISLPTFAAPPALAKETVYMPSAVAARVLGRATCNGDADRLQARQPVQKTP